MVPFAINYGGGRRFDTLQCRSLLNGSKRADLAGFNERSWATFGRYLHNVPLLEILTDQDIKDVLRDISRAVVMRPGESIQYRQTDAGAFETSMKAVEEIDLQAFRQAGADTSGQTNNSGNAGSPESGVAKTERFKHTEARSLSRISKDAADCHYDILEIAARYMMPKPPPIDVPAFTGSVRYPQRFDLADVQELIGHYVKMAPYIKSVSWHRDMLTRIGLLLLGDVSREQAAEFEQEIETTTAGQPDAALPKVMVAPGQNTMTAGPQAKPPMPAAKQPIKSRIE